MKNSGLEEEERRVGEVFIKEYNKLHNSDFSLQRDPVDTDADLIFYSNTREKLSVQITQATSEEEERQISNGLKNSDTAWDIGDDPSEEILFCAIKRKCDKNYANPQHLVLVVYRFAPIALPKKIEVPEHIKIPFKEVWFVKFGNKPHIMRIYPLPSATSKRKFLS